MKKEPGHRCQLCGKTFYGYAHGWKGKYVVCYACTLSPGQKASQKLIWAQEPRSSESDTRVAGVPNIAFKAPGGSQERGSMHQNGAK